MSFLNPIKYIASLFRKPTVSPKEYKSSIIYLKPIGINEPTPKYNRPIKDCKCNKCGETWQNDIIGDYLIGAVLEYNECSKCFNYSCNNLTYNNGQLEVNNG